MAAAFIIVGVAGMIGRRPSVAVIGLLAGAVTAFVPTILGTLIAQNTATALSLLVCGTASKAGAQETDPTYPAGSPPVIEPHEAGRAYLGRSLAPGEDGGGGG